MSLAEVGPVYAWAAVVELHVWLNAGRVPRIEFRTAKERFRIPVPRSVDLAAVLPAVTRWYGQPVAPENWLVGTTDCG
jgi:hypothetical protein